MPELGLLKRPRKPLVDVFPQFFFWKLAFNLKQYQEKWKFNTINLHCKVILNIREEDSRVESLVRQLDSLHTARSKIVSMLSPSARKMQYIFDSFLTAAIGSCNTKSTYVIRKRCRIHNHHVKSIVPADKLLVYNVKQGWKPLCGFLECDVPTIAFQHENIKAEITKTIMTWGYGQHVKREFRSRVVKIVLLLVVAVGLSLAIFLHHWANWPQNNNNDIFADLVDTFGFVWD